jgi:hypothetical protein
LTLRDFWNVDARDKRRHDESLGRLISRSPIGTPLTPVIPNYAIGKRIFSTAIERVVVPAAALTDRNSLLR